MGSFPLTATLSSTGTTTVRTGLTDGQLGSTPTTFSGTVLAFLPATITAHLETTTPVTATSSSTATTLTASVRLVVDQITVLGLGLVTPGSTNTPSPVTLTGAAGVLSTGGTPMARLGRSPNSPQEGGDHRGRVRHLAEILSGRHPPGPSPPPPWWLGGGVRRSNDCAQPSGA